jgi:DNA relaxase NicK
LTTGSTIPTATANPGSIMSATLSSVMHHKRLPFHAVLMDTWYATKDLMLFIEALQNHFSVNSLIRRYYPISSVSSPVFGRSFDSLHERKKGLHGYRISFDIGKTTGLFAYDGQCGTALVSLPGTACALITGWPSCYRLFHEILNAQITDGMVP